MLAVAATAVETFPLVPRRPLDGLELGPFRGIRRGRGADPAGSRPYERGDDVRTVDWGASARLSAARGADEFIVRERFVEQAPRIVIVTDRRPGMALYGRPWLSKPAVLEVCERLIAESAFRSRGLVGELHYGSGETLWLRPTGNPRVWRTRLPAAGFSAPLGSLADGLDALGHARVLPPGSFVFVLSDFLDPVAEETWLAALSRGWDVVPVIVQDRTWEASFPESVGGLVLPLLDPATGQHGLVRLSRAEALARRAHHEQRLARLGRGFAELDLDPIHLHSEEPDTILAAFLEWASNRLAPAGRAW
jgi:uncharacterized protein (DUF58 family)